MDDVSVHLREALHGVPQFGVFRLGKRDILAQVGAVAAVRAAEQVAAAVQHGAQKPRF